MNIRILIMSVAMAATAGVVWAKLPPAPVDAAKAAEAKKKADDTAKKDAEMLGKAQDRAAANYRKNKGIRGLPATAKAAPRNSRTANRTTSRPSRPATPARASRAK